MTSQILITTIISTLVITLALQLSEQKSLIVEYCHNLCFYIWNEVIQNGGKGKTSLRIAQFGALVLLRKLYTDLISPLHMIVSTYGSASHLKELYGSWGVIACDLDLGDKALIRGFAKDFIMKGMNVLILDCSLDGHKKNEREEKMRNDVVKLFIEDLKQSASERINEMQNGSQSNGVGTNHKTPEVDLLMLKESSLPKFRSQITSKLGDIAKSGGIGVLVHCFSSMQARNNMNSSGTNDYSPCYGKSGTEQFFVTILNLTLPYMIFRGIGAIVNISQYDDQTVEGSDGKNEACSARGYAECAFYTQLIRSLHYEYGEHGIDCLAVTLPSVKKSFDAETIVQSTLQILGEESELDLKICKCVSILKHFYKF